MLHRSAVRQRLSSRSLAASFSQLNLPWLAPAQLRWISSQPETPPRRRRRLSHGHRQSRQLATAVEQYQVSSDIPFESQTPLDPSFSGQFSLSKFPNKDFPSPLKPVIIDTSTMKPDPSVFVSTGLNGNKMDLFQHLHTSLRVGRYDRAREIIRRLTPLCDPSSLDLSHAHFLYLRGLAEEGVQAAGDNEKIRTQAYRKVQRWFEQEIVAHGIIVNAPMLVIVVKSALGCLKNPVKAIKTYLEMAQSIDAEAYEEVVYSDEYTDEEYDAIGRVLEQASLEEDISAESSGERVVKELDLVQRPDMIETESLPEPVPTNQRGSGLQGVKDSLQTFVDLPPMPADAPIDERKARAMERQLAMEQTVVEVAIKRWRQEEEQLRKVGVRGYLSTKPLGALMWQWFSDLLPKLEAEVEECKKVAAKWGPATDIARSAYSSHIQLIPVRDLAASTILFVISRIADQKNRATDEHESEVKITNLGLSLAKQLELECNSNTNLRPNVTSWRKNVPISTKPRRMPRRKAPEPVDSVPKDLLAWPTDVKAKLGAMLIEKLIEAAQLPVSRSNARTGETVTQLQPAFLHRVKYTNGKRLGYLIANSTLLAKLETEPVGSLLAKRMPMIVEPLPWSEWDMGGYYHYASPILRLGISDKSAKDYFRAADKQGDMSLVYAGVNALGKVPWKINHDVLKVQLEAWNSGEDIANFAPLHPKFELPPEPESSTDPNARRKWLTEVRELDNKVSGLHSKRCYQNFQIEIARSMVNETLYFPHNLDFRGRAYPIPPYLNHMGADNARALLTFANGKELGVSGLRWLKIHLSNVFGYDKASLQEREAFVMNHLDDIRDSVRDPLGGRKWWLQSEDAWQTLAACFELVHALDSPDPIKYVSHLPVHQDGTCNGLQHYAALGGDKAGAAQVNLEPGDRPADIYAAVAAAVDAEVEKDAAANNEIAKFLQGKITRKLVKQPVMTNVYGVTLYGAKAQVRSQLEDLFPTIRKFDEINYGNLSSYLADKIFISLGSMFKGAQAIQTWLGECANLITASITAEQVKILLDPPPPNPNTRVRKSQSEKDKTNPVFKTPVIWTSPLRLPVVQPYRKALPTRVKTPLQRIILAEPKVWDPVSSKKQLQGFPPNFIHSLDATHMMLSAIKCDNLGLTFASVHDSFWTHACDIPTLSTVLRDAFVAMHSDDITGRLLEEFNTRYKGCMHYLQYRQGHPAADDIKRWRRKNRAVLGKSSNAELKMEMERIRLLESEDAEEKEQGEKMITPGSIMEAWQSGHKAVPAEVQAINKLGEVNDESPTQDEDVVDELEDVDEEKADEVVTGVKTVPSRNFHNVWMRLRFPEIPEKGDFDVTRLRESKYFFH